MSGSQESSTEAELCLQTIEAADNSMFRYLSFFAAIHGAAFTALASEAVGLRAFLDEIGPGSQEPVVLLLPSLAIFMAGLCYVAARGLSDAAFTYGTAIEYGRNLDTELASFFESVHGVGFDEGENLLSGLFTGRVRLLSRHNRAAVVAAGVGVLWSAFFLGLIWGFPGPISEDSGTLIDGLGSIAVSALGVVSVSIGLVLLAQTVSQEVDSEDWIDATDQHRDEA